jgi:hypothetical protein
VAACGERRRCSDGEGRRVATCGDRRGGGGGAPGNRGVSCGEGLGGLGTGVWHDGARTARGDAWGSEG